MDTLEMKYADFLAAQRQEPLPSLQYVEEESDKTAFEWNLTPSEAVEHVRATMISLLLWNKDTMTPNAVDTTTKRLVEQGLIPKEFRWLAMCYFGGTETYEVVCEMAAKMNFSIPTGHPTCKHVIEISRFADSQVAKMLKIAAKIGGLSAKKLDQLLLDIRRKHDPNSSEERPRKRGRLRPEESDKENEDLIAERRILLRKSPRKLALKAKKETRASELRRSRKKVELIPAWPESLCGEEDIWSETCGLERNGLFLGISTISAEFTKDTKLAMVYDTLFITTEKSIIPENMDFVFRLVRNIRCAALIIIATEENNSLMLKRLMSNNILRSLIRFIGVMKIFDAGPVKLIVQLSRQSRDFLDERHGPLSRILSANSESHVLLHFSMKSSI